MGLLSAIAEAVSASAGGPMLSGRIFAGYEDAVAEAADHPGLTELAAGQPGPGPWGATPRVFQLTLKEFATDLAALSHERFGPAGLVITYPSVVDLLPVLAALAGNLVGTVHADEGSADDLELARQVAAVGRASRAMSPTQIAAEGSAATGAPAGRGLPKAGAVMLATASRSATVRPSDATFSACTCRTSPSKTRLVRPARSFGPPLAAGSSRLSVTR